MNKIPVFCFSHAGGMSFAYRDFVAANTTGLYEYIPIDTAGHGKRMGDKLLYTFDEIVDDLYEKVCIKLGDRQEFLLMGHSMGAWIAFEIAKKLQAKKRLSPKLMVLSSNVPARYYSDRVLINAGDDTIRQQLLERNPDLLQFFEDEVLNATFYPIIKADYIAIDNYLSKNVDGMKLSCNVLGLLADGDRFDVKTMERWKEYIDGVFILKILSGDHFAFYKEQEYVMRLIEDSVV